MAFEAAEFAFPASGISNSPAPGQSEKSSHCKFTTYKSKVDPSLRGRCRFYCNGRFAAVYWPMSPQELSLRPMAAAPHDPRDRLPPNLLWVTRLGNACARNWMVLDRTGRLFVACLGAASLGSASLAIAGGPCAGTDSTGSHSKFLRCPLGSAPRRRNETNTAEDGPRRFCGKDVHSVREHACATNDDNYDYRSSQSSHDPFRFRQSGRTWEDETDEEVTGYLERNRGRPIADRVIEVQEKQNAWKACRIKGTILPGGSERWIQLKSLTFSFRIQPVTTGDRGA